MDGVLIGMLVFVACTVLVVFALERERRQQRRHEAFIKEHFSDYVFNAISEEEYTTEDGCRVWSEVWIRASAEDCGSKMLRDATEYATKFWTRMEAKDKKKAARLRRKANRLDPPPTGDDR